MLAMDEMDMPCFAGTEANWVCTRSAFLAAQLGGDPVGLLTSFVLRHLGPQASLLQCMR